MKVGMSAKVIILFLIAGLVPLGISGFVGQRTAKKALKQQAFNQLVSIRETKKEQVEEYFSYIEKQITAYSRDQLIINAMEEFKASFKLFRQENEIDDAQLNEYRSELKRYYTRDFTKEYIKQNNGRNPDINKYLAQLDDDSVLLQYFYIQSNDYVLGEKNKLDFASDRSTYSNHHSYYHPIIREFQEQFGYYDIFLVDPDSGDIVYSVFKEVDFTTSLKDGPYADTNLGKVFREVNKSTNPEFVKLVDFSPYAPSYESAASFIASPIFDGQRKVGVLIFQMPIDRINLVMTSNHNWKSSGLGESGETYIIGSDYTMRSQSRFLIDDKESYHAQMEALGIDKSLLNIIKAKDSTILLQKIETRGTHAAISGETNVEIFPDYRHIPVLSAYAPLGIKGVNWAIMAEIDKEEALRAATTLGKRMMMLSGILLVLIIGLSILVLRITGRVTNVIKKMVESLTDCSSQISAASEQISASSQTLAEGASEQASSLEETSASMEEMSSITKQNAHNADETSKLVDMCTTAAEDGNRAVGEMSNSMEDINESSKKIAEIVKVIDGIASQTDSLAYKAGNDTAQVIKQGNSFAVVAKEVRNLANQSMAAVKDTRVIVEDCITNADKLENETNKHKEFKENIKKIAKGIKGIETIAFQTSLLALNAAVEAARASDNGEKFAAVAEEVRSLAKKSADAAKETTALINECVTNADNGTRVAAKCKESMGNIVKNVKKASTLTKEITVASTEQSEGINQVSTAVQQMDQVTQQNAASAEETASASEELAAQAQTMKEQIEILAMQVGGKGNGKLHTKKSDKPDKKKVRKADNETAGKVSKQQFEDKKTSSNMVFKLLLSPIYILKAIVKLRKRNDSTNKGIKSESMDSTETAPDKNTGGNGNGNKENVLIKTASNDSLIPMGENRIPEHDERFKDF
ncbi:MAG: methyl-accepting chemotaxis protein [Candidatus Scalindua sp.]